MSGRRKIMTLRVGDPVKMADGSTAIVTHAKKSDGDTAYPHRGSAARVPVPAWYVIYRPRGGAEMGGLFDPDDEVLVP